MKNKQNRVANLSNISFKNGPRGIIRGSVKMIHEKTDIKNLVTMSL
jgi:hypothetical protein